MSSAISAWSAAHELQRLQTLVGDMLTQARALGASDAEVGVSRDLGLQVQVRAGEVVGIAGVSGNGQKELMLALSGEDTRADAAAIAVRGHNAGKLSPGRRRALGLHFVPEERLGRGAVPSLSLSRNLLLTRREAVGAVGWLRRGLMQAQARRILARFNVKSGGPQAAARSLSGGNLQKFIVGREIDAAPALLIVSQPTWGVDVGAATQIRGELLKLRDAGCAVLVVSEELDELFEICDRLYVMARGQLSPSLARAQATVALVGQWMSGLWEIAGQTAAAQRQALSPTDQKAVDGAA
jgi:simple sugar transport system ATP-binding protein